jgi:tagatose 1,6-diphosphate aldolase
MIMTLENSIFDDRPDGRVTSTIDDWSVEKIKRIGADGVKFLAWYRSDAGPEVLEHQQRVVADTGAACRRADIPFILELLLYPFADEAPATAPTGQRRTEMIIESVETFAAPEYGVDLFKLESPISAQDLTDGEAAGRSSQGAFEELHRAAGRPWVLLSGGAEPEAFVKMLSLAYAAGASGYLAGRSIWWEALQHYPDLGCVEAGLRSQGSSFMKRINDVTSAAAASWVGVGEWSARPPWNDVPSNYAGSLR